MKSTAAYGVLRRRLGALELIRAVLNGNCDRTIAARRTNGRSQLAWSEDRCSVVLVNDNDNENLR